MKNFDVSWLQGEILIIIIAILISLPREYLTVGT